MIDGLFFIVKLWAVYNVCVGWGNWIKIVSAALWGRVSKGYFLYEAYPRFHFLPLTVVLLTLLDLELADKYEANEWQM